jgi:signal transduction histidine kinase
MRLLPRSLAGQMAMLIGAALLLAQLASFAYLLVERHQFTRAEVETPAITRFTSTAADAAQATSDFQPLVLKDASRRGAQYAFAASPEFPASADRSSDTEGRLRESLASAGVAATDVRAALDTSAQGRPGGDAHRRRPQQAMLLSARLSDGRWLNGRLSVPAPPALITPQLAVGTLLLYLFVLAAAVLMATRIARPLQRLTRAAEIFRGNAEASAVEPSGPGDVREAILAFNAMNERVARLLEEKDRTLGAIGHDLRTPLASLRIRVESVQPEGDRERMIATIEEMTATLADILTLARSGHSAEARENIDLTELARAVADEFRELGSDVAFTSDGAHVVELQPNLMRRAVRNLVDNAIKYAGAAAVEVRGRDGEIALSVVDRGPGLPDEELHRVSGPFYRGEKSRNRATGGAGLGLSIAEAIVDAQGGKLILANRDGGGLTATLILPAQPARSC